MLIDEYDFEKVPITYGFGAFQSIPESFDKN